MQNSLKHLLRLLGASCALIVAAAALNFAVDPLQLFRPAHFYPPMYSQDTRIQNAGLVRSQKFDTAFMGTSLAIHFRQSEIDRVLGVKSLKLTMTGSNSKQQAFVLNEAIAYGAKRVIWEMDDWIFVDAPDIDSDRYFPTDLHRKNFRGVADYLLSGAMARESLVLLAKSVPPIEPVVSKLAQSPFVKFSIADVDDIYALPRNFDISATYNAAKAKAAFAYITDPVRSAYLAENYDSEAMIRNFEHDAVGLINSHPDVAFEIYLPPYSILQFVAMRDASPAALKIVYDVTAHISRRLTQLPNVSLYDFRDIAEITHDLSNYSDVIHHSPEVDRKILSFLAAREHAVDRLAPTASLDRLKAQVEAYRIEDIRR